MALSLLFFFRLTGYSKFHYSILFVQVTLSHFSKFKIIVGMSLPFLLIGLNICAENPNSK